ncbi:hypothetical protein ACIBF5_08105 [Micromonospora sp. NPDC050417]|uniref:WXG100-like domain-containing protein n=1 Tax=Micromonospora sp. NPDC050417 TaxID=3364280 RepID=UPI0037924843
MIDAHHVPPELQNLLMILVGNKWPTGDETALRAEAAAWREAARTARSCAEKVATVKHLVDEGLEGETRQAFDDYVVGLIGTGPGDESAILPLLAACCDSAADSLEELANEIETLRITIIGCLVVLFIQLALDALMWAFGGAAKAAADIAAGRTFLWGVLRRVIITAVTRVAESILAQVGFTLLAQLIERAQGHRRSLNGKQLATAAVNGAVGGTVGVGAGFLGGILRSGAGKILKSGFERLPGAGRLPGTGSVLPVVGKAAGNLTWGAGYGALAGMAEGAAQDAVFGLSGDWVSGAANGAFNGAWGVRHTAMNPGNKLSIAPADHIEKGLNRYLDGRARPQSPAASNSGDGDNPPMNDVPDLYRSPTPVSGDGDNSSTNDVPDPYQWPASTSGDGHEMWQDVPSSNNPTLIRPPANMPPPPAEPNPWASTSANTNTAVPHTPPHSGDLPPEPVNGPSTDGNTTTPVSHTAGAPSD